MAAVANRRIGILGGMGPEATVLLMSRVIAATPANDDSDHVPLLIDSNTQVPSRIKALVERTGEDPGPVLADMARRLEANGAAALAMPCNTAHHYAPVIRRAVVVPFLDMVDLSIARLLARPMVNRRMGLLASPAVRITGVFDRAATQAGLATIYPKDENRMLSAIRAIKRNGDDPGARSTLQDAARELMAEGADVLVVACSEFSIIADAVPEECPVIDTIDVLAEAVVAFARDGAKSRTQDAQDGINGTLPANQAGVVPNPNNAALRPGAAAQSESPGRQNRETAR